MSFFGCEVKWFVKCMVVVVGFVCCLFCGIYDINFECDLESMDLWVRGMEGLIDNIVWK